MLRFNLLGFPVTIKPWFWLVAAFLSDALGNMNGEWGLVFGKVAIVFVSIIFHEIGHAWFQRKYGGQPEIVLHGFGGYALDRAGQPTRNQSLWIVGMGPAFSILLGIVACIWIRSLNADASINPFAPSRPYTQVEALASFAIFVNLGWAALNLLPIFPLDGGQLLSYAMYQRQPQLRYRIAMVVAGLLAFYFLTNGAFFGGIMFGMLAYENFQRSQGQNPRGFLG